MIYEGSSEIQTLIQAGYALGERCGQASALRAARLRRGTVAELTFSAISSLNRPSFIFVLAFLLFSLIFLFNTYRLWFKTDQYYQELRSSLSVTPSLYPFRGFFLRRMENRKRWEFWQKAFSIFGLIAVLAADALVLTAWLSGN